LENRIFSFIASLEIRVVSYSNKALILACMTNVRDLVSGVNGEQY
jgi:hypothetical protein